MTGPDAIESVDVAIVGGGPAGLTAAAELARRLGPATVVVLEREDAAGGIPRHSDHTGYGLRDRHRFSRGPDYARRLAADARAAGATSSNPVSCSPTSRRASGGETDR